MIKKFKNSRFKIALFSAGILICFLANSCGGNTASGKKEKISADSNSKTDSGISERDTAKLPMSGDFNGNGFSFHLKQVSKIAYHIAADSSAWVSLTHWIGLDTADQNGQMTTYQLRHAAMMKSDSVVYFFQKDSTLFLRLKNGSTVSFVNNPSQEMEYSYSGRLGNSGYYFISEYFDEDAKYFLVNENTGEKTEIRAEPQLSPNGNLIFCSAAMNEMTGDPGRIQLFRINGNHLEKIVEKTCADWSPEYSKWTNDSTLFFVEDRSLDTPEDSLKQYAMLQLRENK
jgi:hypothetical protein